MVKRVVLTGGPGSGKTTVLNRIINHGRKVGIKVIVVPETATEIINAGLNCFKEDAIDLVDFQELVMRLQLDKEAIYDLASEMYLKKYSNQDILIIYDRGTIDNMAYMNKEQFITVLNRLNNVKTYAELLMKYDLVLDLVGAKEFYTLENNEARSEDAETALQLGVNTLRSWLRHPKIKVILPKENMEEKIAETLGYIDSLFCKKQVKKQYKFLVELQDLDGIPELQHAKYTEIEQAYLVAEENIEKRIRKTTIEGSSVYELVVYKRMENGENVLVSSQSMDEAMYLTLLTFKDPTTEVIRKKRIYFTCEGQYCYLDKFASSDEWALLEINTEDERSLRLPDLPIVSNVTDVEEFKNRNLAKKEKSILLEKKMKK